MDYRDLASGVCNPPELVPLSKPDIWGLSRSVVPPAAPPALETATAPPGDPLARRLRGIQIKAATAAPVVPLAAPPALEAATAPPVEGGHPPTEVTGCGGLGPVEELVFQREMARLRKDLAKREFDDLKHGNVITEGQFRQRAAQILSSYSVPEAGQRHSYLQKLVRGMPARLAKCRKNKFGPCGK